MTDFIHTFFQVVSPGLLLLIGSLLLLSFKKTGWIEEFVNSLNTLNTPWIAIIVVVLGMLYNIKCKVYGLDSSSANQVIGAGIGLLTGQAIEARKREASVSVTRTTIDGPPPELPATPATPPETSKP